MERLPDRNHGRYVPIDLEEGMSLIDAAETASDYARHALATLQVSSPVPTALDLSTTPPADGFSPQELQSATRIG
jgi:hypothetical protein